MATFSNVPGFRLLHAICGMGLGGVMSVMVFAATPTGVTLSPSVVWENAPANVLVGNLTALDPDGGDSHTFSLVEGIGGESNNGFIISGNQLLLKYGVVKADGYFVDFETEPLTFPILVRVRDAAGATHDQALIISMLDDRNEDADGDGLTEAQEEDLHGTSDVNIDFDGDGFGDRIEVLNGSSPTNSNSLPNYPLVGWGSNQTNELLAPDNAAFSSISTGQHHTLGLKPLGTVSAWAGSNAYGQINVPADLTQVVAVAAGGDNWLQDTAHSLAVKSNGTVVAWGCNEDGQIDIPADLSGAVSVAAGRAHSLALKSNGTVVAWGENLRGQTTVPADLSDVVDIAAAGFFSMALKSDGSVVSWGRYFDDVEWQEMRTPAGLSDVVAISAGFYHAMALSSDGTVICWGYNGDGQCTVPPGLDNVVGIAGGGFHSLALKANGSVVGWGSNTSGQTTIPNGALSQVRRISAGLQQSLALRETATNPSITSPTRILGSPGVPLNHQIALSNLTPPYYVAFEANQLLVLHGGPTLPDAVISQTFATVPGQPYVLTFNVGTFANNLVEQRLKVDVVGLGSLVSDTVILNGNGAGNSNWSSQTYSFTADDSTTTLTFTDTSSTTDDIDLLLDNVAVSGPQGASNTAPVAVAESYSTSQNTALIVVSPSLLGNDTDVENNPLTAVLVTNVTNGSLDLNPNGSFTYTPTNGYIGPDSFTYKANDGLLDSNTITVSLAVYPIIQETLVNGSFESDYSGWTHTGNQSIQSNLPYLATDGTKLVAFNNDQQTPNGVLSQTFGTAPGQSYTLTFDAGTLSYIASQQKLQVTVDGTVNLLTQLITINTSATNSSTYEPYSFNFIADSGATTLTFRDLSATGSALDLILDNVKVDGPTAGSFAPIAVADSYLTSKDIPLVVAAAGVLSNDTDADSNPLAPVLVTNVTNGALNLAPDGGFTYTPNTGYSGPDSFTYKANDGLLDSVIVSVSITVAPARPILVNGGFEENETGWTMTGNRAVVTTSNLLFTAMGLPAGLSLDPHSGAISGTVAGPVRGTVYLRVDSSQGTLEQVVWLNVFSGVSPTAIHVSPAGVMENAAVDAVVAILTADDADPGDTHTFELIDGPGASDNASFRIEGSQLIAAKRMDRDYEQNPLPLSIRLRVRDASLNPYEAAISLQLLDDRTEDADGDGLTEMQEEDIYGTSDTIVDSDGDGFGDGFEVGNGTSPINAASFPQGNILVAWGNNGHGETTIPPGLGEVVAVASGWRHNLVLKGDGTVAAWGWNNEGQCTVPPGLSGVAAVSAGDFHSMALKADGTVVAWGSINSLPVAVPVNLSGVVAISAGSNHCVALKSNGTVVAWGDDEYEQLHVPSGQDFVFLDGVILDHVVAIAAGGYYTLALKDDGTVVAWGWSGLGAVTVPEGLEEVVGIAAGGGHSLALLRGGAVVAWGDDEEGQSLVPEGLTDVVDIKAGWKHSLAVKQDGSVVSWGSNLYGQNTEPLEAIQVQAISAGSFHNLAIRQSANFPKILPASPVLGWPGQVISHPISIQGATSPYQFSAMGLPAGLSIGLNTGIISGTVTSGQVRSARIMAATDKGLLTRIIWMDTLHGSPPTSITFTPTNQENGHAILLDSSPLGTVVGTLAATDPDANDSHTFAVNVRDGSEAYCLVAQGNQLLVQSSAGLEFQSDGILTLWVRATDQGENSIEQTFTIQLLDDRTEDADGDGLSEAMEEDNFFTSDLQVDDLTTADADGDGVPTLVEFAFNLNLQSPDAGKLLGAAGSTSGLPVYRTIIDPQGNRRLRMEYLRRIGAGLNYVPQFSSGMDSTNWSPAVGVLQIVPIDSLWERCVIDDTEFTPSPAFRFGRVGVSQ